MNMMRMVVVCSVALLAACGKVTTTKPDGGTAADGGSGGGTGGGTGVGSGGGGGNVAVCGDGTKAASEACDDGNKMVDDGCSATCTVETGWNCTGSPKSTCTRLTCGNGKLDNGEQCDDGNTAANDGCSGACQVEAGWEIEPNNTDATANDFAARALDSAVQGKIGNGPSYPDGGVPADKDVFTVVVPAGTSGLFVIETRDSSGKSCTKRQIDTELVVRDQLGGTVPVTSSSRDIDSVANYCSRVSFTDPAPGTYFVEVKAETSSKKFPYTLWMGPSICGDGQVTFPEDCDDGNMNDGDGCDSACKMPIACGNGLKQTGEECDDGNTTNGDGCSSTCAEETGFTCAGTRPSICSPPCGDGFVDYFYGDEECDDFNTQSGDGCSSTCTVEPGYSCNSSDPSECKLIVCGDGVKDTGEGCDDKNTTSGDGCSATCTVEAGFICSGTPSLCKVKPCGNGVLETGEKCDDGNDVSGDGCDSSCYVESNFTCAPGGNGTSVCTAACASATAIPVLAVGSPSTVTGSLNLDDENFYSFTLAKFSSIRVETFDSSGTTCSNTGTPGTAPDGGTAGGVDTTLYMYASNCSTELNYDSSDGVDYCSLFDPSTDSEVQNLAPGNYFLKVTDGWMASPPFSYSLTLTVVSECGNGAVEAGELCDGTPGCSASCNGLCGNGIIEAGETCDDANATAGDGCDATCNREGTPATEVEPNDWSCTATTCTFATNASAQQLTGTVITVLGDHSVGTDSDVYTLDLQQGANVRIEIVEGDMSETCESNGIDSKVWLRNSTFSSLASDDDDGRGYCSLIDGTGATPKDAAASNLPAGKYYVEVNKSSVPSATSASAKFTYKLLIDVK